LKLQLLTLELEKKACIRSQHYELAADIREREREYLEKLNDKKNRLLEAAQEFDQTAENLADYYFLLSSLNEISLYHSPFLHIEEVVEDFGKVLLAEKEALLETKRAYNQQHKFKEANEIQKQILEIGRFIYAFRK